MTKFLRFLLVPFLIFAACSSDKEELLPPSKEELDVASNHLKIEVDRSAQTTVVPLITNLKVKDLKIEQTGVWFVASLKDTESSAVIEIKIRENETGAQRQGTVTVKTSSKLNSITLNVIQLSGNLAVEGDIQVEVLDSKASESQPGQGIENTHDGNMETGYHSPWSNTHMPVTMEYIFSGKETINYIIYRSGNGNGNFGKFTLYAATNSAHTYEKVGDYDFFEKGGSSTITLPGNGIKATAIKFEIKSGTNGFASCKEMEFWSYGTNSTLNGQLLSVFKDLSCSELRADVTEEKIESLNEYFRHVARLLYNNTYDEYEKDFRIREYKPYSNCAEWAEKLMTHPYSDLDNPTGIYVSKGDEVVVCVGNTNGNPLTLQCIGDDLIKDNRGDYLQTQQSGPTYLLKEGINKLEMTSEGQLFIMYTLSDITASTAKPIKVHFAPGCDSKVTGFFDLYEHKTDSKFVEIMGKAKHKKIAIKGESVIMYFNRSKIDNTKIVEAITLWDNMAQWEQEFCGIDRYRERNGGAYNNHIMAISPEADNGQLFFWTSDYRTAYIWSALKDNVIDLNTALSRPGKMWGVSHEFGHVHQDAINFEPATETSANVYAHYVCERMGKYTSHGCGLYYLAKLRAETSGEYLKWIAKEQGPYANINNRMWWQLYIYYYKVLDKKDFYVKVHDYMREKRLSSRNQISQKSLEFVKACSQAANEDLTDFFRLWGFLKPVSGKVDDTLPYNVTQSMIDETIKFMQQYPKPKHAVEYIEDRKKGYLDGDFEYERDHIGDLGFFETYKKNLKLSANIKATISGRNVTVTNGDEAVCFEVRKDNETGEIRYFSNFLKFEIPEAVNTLGCKIYAVQADGTRKHLADI